MCSYILNLRRRCVETLTVNSNGKRGVIGLGLGTASLFGGVFTDDGVLREGLADASLGVSLCYLEYLLTESRRCELSWVVKAEGRRCVSESGFRVVGGRCCIDAMRC